MVLGTFSTDADIVEFDTTKGWLSVGEISEYSIRHYIQTRLTAWNWDIDVKPSDDGWSDDDEIVLPAVYVDLRDVEVAGVELGSNGSRILVNVQIYGENPAQRTRLAELITKNVFRDTVPIFDYVTGNEVNPDTTGEYFITDSVGWTKLPSAYNAPDSQRYRANVSATLRRAE